MSASLLILAAGLGTRFKGGIKQLTPVGTDGELLMEYSVADAVRAGFDKVISIIRRDINEQFEELIGSRLRKYVKVCCCYQDMDYLPDGFSAPEGRTKPWALFMPFLRQGNLSTSLFLSSMRTIITVRLHIKMYMTSLQIPKGSRGSTA